MPDGYEKWEAIYHSVKQFVPNAKDGDREKAKAEKNMLKPQSISSPGMSVTGDTAPHMMTEQKRRDNWQRMNRIIKGL